MVLLNGQLTSILVSHLKVFQRQAYQISCSYGLAIKRATITYQLRMRVDLSRLKTYILTAYYVDLTCVVLSHFCINRVHFPETLWLSPLTDTAFGSTTILVSGL